MGGMVAETVRTLPAGGGSGLWEANVSDIREQLSNHLTAHGVPLELGIPSTDLEDILRSMDYAMLLGMIEPRQAGLLMAKYLGDIQEERKCRAWWLQDCIEIATLRGWKRPRARMVQGMAYATMDEHMGHGTRCGVCNGTRERMVGHLPVVCPACEGRGFVEYDPARFCDEIGCTMLEWDKAWRDRVAWARRALFRWEVDAVEALVRRRG